MLLFEDFGESLSKIMSSLTSNDLNQTKHGTELTRFLLLLVDTMLEKRTCFFLGSTLLPTKQYYLPRFGLYR